MGLASKDDLNGSTRSVEEILQPFYILKDQGSTLVGGETAGKAQGQDILLKDWPDRGLVPYVAVVGRKTGAGEADELVLELLPCLPEDLIGDLVDLLPDLRVFKLLLPRFAQVGTVELTQLRG